MIPGMTAPEPVSGPVDNNRETRIVPVHGRNIVIRRLIDAQLMQMNHESELLQRDDVGMDRKRKGMERMFRALLSVVVQPTDRDYMEDLMADGELDLRELVSFATSFLTEDTPAGPPKVRRGRPATKR
jgi:hypothetical protein